jgi:adenylate cyclase
MKVFAERMSPVIGAAVAAPAICGGSDPPIHPAAPPLGRRGSRGCGVGQADPGSDLIEWVLRTATVNDDLGALLTGVCERMGEAGLPIWRATLDLPTIDPTFRALSHKWWRDRPGSVETLLHGPGQDGAFQRSVIHHLLSIGLNERRWRLETGDGVADFDLLQTLLKAGGTDYIMRLVPFGAERTVIRGVALSIATDRAGGFADEDIASFDRLVPALGLAACRISAARTATDALSVYLGPKTAERVLAGEIRRGEGERIAAAIFLADLKRFTSFSEQEDPVRVVHWLNEHLEVVGDAVTARGGEILKFLGDGLLAVFPVTDADRQPCPICEDALRAAEEVVAANGALNGTRAARGEPALDVDVALHFGEAVYGNVGASRRLDFTVIGRAVNEISRMEMLCDRIGRSIVLSEIFAQRCSRPTVALGAFALRGIAGDRVLYAVR